MEEETPWPSVIDVYPILAGATNYEPRHEEYWKQLTLQEALARGERLRAQKARAPRRDKEYKVVGLEYIKRPPLMKRGSQTCSCASPKHKKSSLKNTPKRQGTCDFISYKKYKKSQTCSMRIEELAVPRKRLCLDTWRDNYQILPEIMVNRLREHVLDQRVIVKVDDAIRCFRNKRKKKSSINQESPSPRQPKKLAKDMDELKCLCWKLVGKMCKQLIVPLKIRLNPQQQRVAQIVARDIKDMMRSRKERDIGYNRILCDVSTMVSVWISTILEETSNRLLDEALRELEEEEGPVLDILDSIMDVIGKSKDSLVGTLESSDSDHKDEGDGMDPGQLNTVKMIDETGDFKEHDDAPKKNELHSESDSMAPHSKSESTAVSLKAVLSEDSVLPNGDTDADITSSGVELVDEDKPEKYEDGEHSEKDREKNAQEILEEERKVKYGDTEVLERYLGTEFVDDKKPDVLNDSEDSDKVPSTESLDEHISESKVVAEKSFMADIVGQETKTSLETKLADEDQIGEFKDIELSQGLPDTEISPIGNENFVDADDTMDDQKKVTFDALGINQLTSSQKKHNSHVELTKHLNPPNDHILRNITETLEKNQSPNVETEEPQSNDTKEEYVDALTINQPKHDSMSSQIDSITENKAQENGAIADNIPVLLTPFDKYTETEEKFPKIEDGDGLKEDNVEIKNKSEQITIQIKDVTPSITAEVEPKEPQLFDNESDINAQTGLKLKEKHDRISSQIKSVTENKAQETGAIVKNSPVPLIPIIPINKYTETEEKFPEKENGNHLKEENVQIENKSEQITIQMKHVTPSITEEVKTKEPQLFINESDINGMTRLKLEEKHDSISYEIESATENKSQETGAIVNNTPVPLIPFNKYTETGEHNFPEIEDGNGLKEENTEIENKSKLITIQNKDVTLSITAEVEPKAPQLFVNESDIDALTELKLEGKSEAPLMTKTVGQIPVLKTGYESAQSNHGVIGLRDESEEIKHEGQLHNKSKLTEIEQQSPILNDEFNLLAQKLDVEIKLSTEVSDDDSAELKTREMSADQPLLEANVTKPVYYSDQIAEVKSENRLDSESTTQESGQENLEVRYSDTQKQVTEVSDDIKNKKIDSMFETASGSQNVKHQKTTQKVSEMLVSKPHSKLDKPKSEVTKVQKLVVNLTKQLVDTKFKDKKKSQKTEPRKQTLEDKYSYKKAKEIKLKSKEQNQPNSEEFCKQTKNREFKIKAKTSKKAETISKVSDQPKGKSIPAKEKSIIVRAEDIPVPDIKEALVQPKFDYKVYLETAPSWVRNQGKGEPSEDSLLTHLRERQTLKERKMRQWCHDLESTAINLEKWCHWIDDASANIMYLKRKRCCERKTVASKGGPPKNWVDLKSCIDKDALLWSKLCHRAVRKLNKYNGVC